MAAPQTVEADQQNRGWFHIKQSNVPIITIWANDVMVVASADEKAETHITIRGANGLFYATTASVAEVNRAVTIAMTLFDAKSKAA